MNNKILIILIIITIYSFKSSNSLRVTDLCLSHDKKCININGTIKCVRNDCISNKKMWKKKCGTDYCSIDDQTCESFKIWTETINEKLTSGKMNDMHAVKKYRRFKLGIRECPLNNNVYEWKLSNLCSKDLNNTSSIIKNYTCNGMKSFKCGEHFCASDENHCNNLVSLLNGTTSFIETYPNLRLFKCKL